MLLVRIRKFYGVIICITPLVDSSIHCKNIVYFRHIDYHSFAFVLCNSKRFFIAWKAYILFNQFHFLIFKWYEIQTYVRYLSYVLWMWESSKGLIIWMLKSKKQKIGNDLRPLYNLKCMELDLLITGAKEYQNCNIMNPHNCSNYWSIVCTNMISE